MSAKETKPAIVHQAVSFTIVLISDTHELHREVEVPAADLLIHAGDFTMFSKSTAAILDFNKWLGELPHTWRILTAGNHEFFLEADPSKRRMISNATLLINESVEIMGLKIWGSPMTPLYGGAFGRSSEQDRVKVYSNIPDDIDILITHGPPYGILDQAPDSDSHAGCHQLLAAVRRIKPMLHVFGHVHGAYGTLSTPDTLFVNAPLPGQGFRLSNPPHAFKLPRR
jgi:Icc-related predicted phosphoesterase